MRYISSRNLFGDNRISFRTLTSNDSYNSSKTPNMIINIKKILFNRILMPLIKDNVISAKKNSYIIPKIKKKIIDLSKLYKKQNLDFYMDLINLSEKMLEKIEENENYQENILKHNGSLGDFVVRVHRLRLLAQYEIYNMIFGQPNKNEQYDEIKIAYIVNLLDNDNLTFESMEEMIKKEFNIIWKDLYIYIINVYYLLTTSTRSCWI